MSIRIPPAHFEPLCEKIGDQFAFDEFDLLLYKCTGDKKINWIAARGDPTRVIARECLEEAERLGVLGPFLAFALQARPQEAPFRQFVLDLVPGLEAIRPEAKEAIDSVVAGLMRTHDLMADPQLRAAVATSRATLETLETAVVRLGIYKAFHDSLQQLLLQRPDEIRDAVRGMAADPRRRNALRRFQTQLRVSHVLAVDWRRKLTGDPLVTAHEDRWIGRLERLSKELADAIDTVNVGKAQIAVSAVGKLLLGEPTRINTSIFTVATALPLDAFQKTLATIADARPDPALVVAIAAVGDLKAVLLARVREHDLWQAADDALWAVDTSFLLPGEDRLVDVAGMWPEAKAKLDFLSGGEPKAEWSRKTGLYAVEIGDELARLEGLLGAGGAGLAAPGTFDVLRERFTAYWSEAFFRFFEADRALKGDCEALLALGGPTRAILASLGP